MSTNLCAKQLIADIVHLEKRSDAGCCKLGLAGGATDSGNQTNLLSPDDDIRISRKRRFPRFVFVISSPHAEILALSRRSLQLGLRSGG